MGTRYSRIGELLVKERYINASDLSYVLNLQKNSPIHKKVGQILIEKNLIDKNKLREALGLFFRVETIDIINQEIDLEALKQLDLKTAFEIPCIPYNFINTSKGESIKVALPDPLNYHYIDKLNFHINYPVIPVFAYEDDIINEVRFYSSQFKK